MFDSYLFVMRGSEITIYLNGVRGKTHPQGAIDIKATRKSTVHLGQVHEGVELPEHLEHIPDTAWVQRIEQIDVLDNSTDDHDKVLQYPSSERPKN